MSQKSTYKITDVLIAFDVENILKKLDGSPQSRSKNNPPSLGSNVNSVYMITTIADAVYGFGQGPYQGLDEGEAGSNLRIKAEVEDVIRWRTVSLTDQADYKCFLYRFKSYGANLLSDVHYLTTNINQPYPLQGWPDNNLVGEEKRADYYAQATVLAPGTETYAFYVAIYDRHAQPKGYFYWDPYINISNR
ncbi:hypothetical protein WK69_14930 [Burkholderia ubonensis]|uniref:AidA/PixA family protein n=1 Tax=Burkholderia ubonensis TaxID=101571 RepID=UPI00075CAB91|nr:AidA/PixA family protein [Burkholderia ubonensis]KVU45840.1 hypothetical protein WK69_14930 [Burkholderia ubonensis]